MDLDLLENCQNYRTEVNGYPAIFSVNIKNIEEFSDQNCNKVVEVTLDYIGGENGLPTETTLDPIIDRILILISSLTKLPQVFFAGYFMANSQAKIHFYCKNEINILFILSELVKDKEFDFINNINVQDDPNWDIYFDFLLASPLELKINATEELLDLLVSKGKDLSNHYLIEHTFHFNEEDKMFPFMEEISSTNYLFSALRYSSEAIKIDEDDEPYFMVKIDQELSLDSQEIFKQVEFFEKMANKHNAEYIGWICDNILEDKNKLN